MILMSSLSLIAMKLHSITMYQMKICGRGGYLRTNFEKGIFVVVCTGVTLFALVLHLNCTVLSQPESSNFVMYIFRSGNFIFRLVSKV